MTAAKISLKKKPVPDVGLSKQSVAEGAKSSPNFEYELVVDGLVKKEFVDKAEALRAAEDLRARAPRVRVEVYGSRSGHRKLVT